MNVTLPLNPKDLCVALDREAPAHLTLAPFDLDDVRATLRRRRPLLLLESNSGAMVDVVEALRPHIEIFIDSLVRVADLVIGDDLQQVLDLGLYNPRLGVLFETLWAARFEHLEHRDFSAPFLELTKTTFDDPSALIRNDALLFWLTLLRQNDATTTRQVILVIRSPGGLDPAMCAFVRAAEHWISLGSPVRIVTEATVS